MNNILVIDKPQGMTSHDVIDIVRKRLKIKKAGHCGTLDPMATGVLVVVMNEATKQSADLSSDEKEYMCQMRLGVSTDTHDSTGRTTHAGATDDITEAEIRDVILSFKGKQQQIPPMVSAKYHKGERLYRLARKGIVVERMPVDIDIKDISILVVSKQCVDLNIVCSKGTYIRTLCHDIGNKLGCGAHMSSLRRIRSGRFHIKDAVALKDI